MSTKVLVFESDATFASELRSELGKLGCTTSVVDDGNVGLQQAAADRPDLILLSIELPRMNGFSVCNKLKKDPALKDVPLIIMSSESSDETFEQHRKLRTRAEDYVHKPIAFGELLNHINAYVKLGAPTFAQSEGQIVIDDEIHLDGSEMEDEGTQIARRPPSFSASASAAAASAASRQQQMQVDPDIDAFADAAFGALTSDDKQAPPSLEPLNGTPAPKPAERTSGPPPLPPPSLAPAGPASLRPKTGSVPAMPATRVSQPPGRPGVDQAELDRAKAETERAKADTERVRGDFEKAKARANELETEVNAARTELSRLRDDAETASGRNDEEARRMQRDIDELKAKLTNATKGGAGGGVSSREFLDLREALNKKDKEILNLRDQLTKKEREVLDNADKMLVLERAKAELDDKIVETDRALADATDKIASLTADKDQAKKVSEDYKARHERVKTDLETRTRELADLKHKSQENEAKSEAELASLRAESRVELERAHEEREAAVEAAETRRRGEAEAAKKALEEAKEHAARERSDALLARERELRQETDGKLAALHRAHTDEMNRVKADHAQKLQASEKVAAEKLTAREAELEAQRVGEVDALTKDRDEKIATMERDHAARTGATEREHAEKVAAIEGDRDERLARAKRESDERIATVENDAGARIAAVEARLSRELSEANAVADAHKAASAEQIKQLETQLGETRATLETLRDAKLAGDRSNEARIAELEAELSTTRETRDTAQAALADVREKNTVIEIDLSVARGDLTETRQRLDTETARAARALAKWGDDRISLDRAKDALAVALQQIEEAESRSLD